MRPTGYSHFEIRSCVFLSSKQDNYCLDALPCDNEKFHGLLVAPYRNTIKAVVIDSMSHPVVESFHDVF